VRIKFNIEKIFYWVLGLSVAVIPMPGNSLSSICMVGLLFVWFFYIPFSNKITILSKNRNSFLVMLIPLALALIGITYTTNFEYGIKKMQLLLPFLVIPLILLSTPKEKDIHRFALSCFSFGTFLASIIGIGKAAYLYINDFGNYFYYARFSELVDKHTTYFSLFIVISSLFIFSELIKSKLKWLWSIPVLVFFVFVLYITSARISIAALAAGVVIIAVFEIKSNLKWIALVLPILIMGVFVMPNFQKRFKPSETETGQISDFEFRKLHWKSVLEAIKYYSPLIGNGTGSNRDFLYDTYKEYRLTSAYELEYNAHNQYLEITLDFGLIGLFLFLCMLVYLMFTFIKMKNPLAIAVFSVFIIYFLTESLFQRQDGVVTFSLIITVFLSLKIKND